MEESINAENPISISVFTARGRSLFQGLLGILNREVGRKADYEMVETQYARLNLWTSNIGALAGENLSLDYRLRLSPDIKEMVVRLLQVLDRNLLQAIDSCDESETDEADLYDTQIAFGKAVKSITASLDRLQTLAIVIRKSSAQSRNLRSQAFHGNGTKNFEEFVLAVLKHRFKEANGSLCEQLAESIALRRRRFEYNRQHQSKLASIATDRSVELVEDIFGQLKIGRKQGSHGGDTSSRVGPQTVHPSNRHYIMPGALEQVDIASTIIPGIFRKTLAAYKPPQSLISRGTSVVDVRLEYPPPPTHDPKQKECSCPYCCEILPFVRVSDERWWRHHVDADIEPYSCISENCQPRPLQFVHFEDWANHMATHGPPKLAWNIHLQMFYCPVCESLEPFRWKQEFMDHLISCHSKEYTQSQLVALGRRSTTTVIRDPHICPLCNCMPDEIKEITPQNREKIEELLPKHIARHLKSLVFMALPYRDDIDDYKSTGTQGPDSSAGRNTIQQYEWDNSGERVVDIGDYDSHVEGLEVPGFVDQPLQSHQLVVPDTETEEYWSFVSPTIKYNLDGDPIIQEFIARQQAQKIYNSTMSSTTGPMVESEVRRPRLKLETQDLNLGPNADLSPVPPAPGGYTSGLQNSPPLRSGTKSSYDDYVDHDPYGDHDAASPPDFATEANSAVAKKELWWECHHCGTPYNSALYPACLGYESDCYGHQPCSRCRHWAQVADPLSLRGGWLTRPADDPSA
ncbi:hypothetical protein TWF281_009046 [Arthrobotrys megalospora]